MTRKTLVKISMFADALDLIVVGQIPGLSWFIDVPVTLCHMAFAGPVGLLTLLEMIPVVGTVPIYTLAAMNYPDPALPGSAGTEHGGHHAG